ncbi:DUF2933 domain-containing protein [Variovorax sp. JS1663]|uniref:DUF2933 domain-containing protein n=1 Tax=Variovorax sp. JS1663 TaxID=1851577 RepID=UPI0013029967|nr:DUF2933 domain-containing protein [Variovorax sp. JS1663]
MDQQHARPSFWKTPFGVISTIVAVMASIYLWVAHKDHVLALLPFAFLAACPLMIEPLDAIAASSRDENGSKHAAGTPFAWGA